MSAITFIPISKQQVEDKIKEVEERCKATVVDWRIEVSGGAELEVELIAVLDDGINVATDIGYRES